MGWPALPAPLDVAHLCLWNDEDTMTCFVACTTAVLITVLLVVAQDFPVVSLQTDDHRRPGRLVPAEAGDGDVWQQMFVCDIFGIFLSPQNTLGGGVSFQSLACTPAGGWVSTRWALDELDQMWVKWILLCQWWSDCELLRFLSSILLNRLPVIDLDSIKAQLVWFFVLEISSSKHLTGFFFFCCSSDNQ